MMSVIAVFPLKTGDSMFVGFDSQNTFHAVIVVHGATGKAISCRCLAEKRYSRLPSRQGLTSPSGPCQLVKPLAWHWKVLKSVGQLKILVICVQSPSTFPPKAPRGQAESSLKGPHHDFQMLIARALGDGCEGEVGFDEQSPDMFQSGAANLGGGRTAKGLGETMLE